jgi:hypothetical protein
MRNLPTILAIVVLGVSASAHAQKADNTRYRWHDGQGLAHFSDSLTAEAMKYGYDIVNDHGLVVQSVPRQMNAEERAAASKLATEQAASARAARALAAAEEQMLAAYPDEASYRMSQQQSLDSIDQRIHTTQINLQSQEKALADLLGRAADIEGDKKPVPKSLTDGIARQRDIVTGQRHAMTRLQDERAQLVQQQVRQLQRYRELKAAQLKQEQADAVQ